MDDAEQTAVIRRVSRRDRSPGLWADREPADPDTQNSAAGEAAAGLASLSFIKTALRRRARLCCIAGVIGLILGAGLFVVHPPAAQATTEVLLTLGPNEDLTTAIDTEIALVESRPVAILALRNLGLRESPSAFLRTYTAASVTNKVIQVTASAHSSGVAVQRANAVTAAYLTFRAGQLTSYQDIVTSSLAADLTQDQAQVATLNRQVNALSGAVPPQTAKLHSLQTQLTNATNTLASQQVSNRGAIQDAEQATAVAIKGTTVLNNATPVKKSLKKSIAIYVVTGLVAGLFLTMGFVVVSALVSDKLRWRDDVACALGTPVRFSVGRMRRSRLRPRGRGLAATGHPDVQRIADHLRAGLGADPADAALAVIPADRAEVPALAVAALALNYARQDKRVMVADLCPGTPVARLFGTTDPGVHPLTVLDTRLVVVIPARGDAVPAGPRTAAGSSDPPEPADPDLLSAHATADILLTLVTLDPMLGAEHVATWASDAVVTVTAGRSTWTRVQAVGEMVRLAGIRLASGVLIGAEKTDESLGIRSFPSASGEPTVAGKDFRPAQGSVLASVNGTSGSIVPDHK
jgi:capsular polysaccharide biosynthesis protein